MTSRLGRALPGIFFAALVIVCYADPLFTRRAFVGRDLVPYNYPLEKVVHDAWSRGRLPVWWDTVSGGRPLMPNPNAGVLYPLRPALSLVPFPVAMKVFPVAHWILGGLGMLLLVRAIGGSRSAAWLGATSFAFSGVIVSELFYTNFHPGASLLPWTLWGVVRPASGPAGRLLGIALPYAALLLAGDVFSLTLAVGSAALWLWLETDPPERWRGAGALALGVSAAILLALPQIFATALLAPETRRIIGGITLREALGFSPPLWRLFELVVPYPFGETWAFDLHRDWGTLVVRHFFTTFFVAPFALAGLWRGRRNPSRGWRFAVVLFALTALAAVAGGFLPPAWGSWPSPIPLRYPEKLMVGATFALALSAAIALDRVRRFQTGGRGLLLVAGALTGLSVLAAAVPEIAARIVVSAAGGAADHVPVAARQLAPALAFGGILWVASAVAAELASTRSRRALVAALVLLTLVPLAANRPIARTAHEGAVYAPTAFARRIARADPEGRYRTVDGSLLRPPSALARPSLGSDLGSLEMDRQSWFYFTPTLWNRGTVINSDIDAGDLSRIESLRRLSSAAASHAGSQGFFSALSLRFAIRYRDQAALPGFRRFGGDALRDWDEDPDALVDVRLATRWREVTGPIDALRTLPGLPADEIVVETGSRREGRARPGTVRILEKSPERLVLETRTADPAWLFVLRGDWSYREVSIDGIPVETRPSQLAFAAAPVPSGSHRVEWREKAPGLEMARFGPVAGVLLLLLPLARRRRPRPE